MMAVRIEETDFGTKTATRRKIDQIVRENPAKFKSMMVRYWYRVKENAIMAITELDAVDTGALRNSIRLIDGGSVGTGISRGKYEVARTDTSLTTFIVAGGGGEINTRKNREVDYAQAVHDGYFRSPTVKRVFRKMNKERKSGGQKKLSPTQFNDTGTFGGSGWVAGRPFLDIAVERTEEYLAELVDKYTKDITENWLKDQPLVSPYSLPLMKYKSKYGG
jgi:hypothetical protein